MYPQIQWFFFKKILKQIATNFSAEVVHAHVVHPAGAISHNLASAIGKPLVITEHWSNTPRYYKKWASSYLGKKAYRNASYILPVSEFLRKRLLLLDPLLNANRVIRIPNVVDENIFFFSEKAPSSDQMIRFIAVSSWNRYKQITKRPELIIQSLAEFSKETNTKVHLTIVGDGDMISEMRSLAQESNMVVEFPGRKNKREISALLKQSDYFIHASNIETFSLVVAEALMTGTPSIVSNAGALPELVPLDCGVVCQNTIEDWVRGLKALTSTKYDGRQISETTSAICSFDSVSSQMQKIYARLRKD